MKQIAFVAVATWLAGAGSAVAAAQTLYYTRPHIADAPLARYPTEALAQHREGETIVAIGYAADGSVADCRVKRSSAVAELDVASCALFGHGKIGNALPTRPSQFIVRWHIPDKPQASNFGGATPIDGGSWVTTNDYFTLPALRKGIRGAVKLAIAITADGDVSDCTSIAGMGDAELARETCALVRQRAKFIPKQNAAGIAQPTQGELGVKFAE